MAGLRGPTTPSLPGFRLKGAVLAIEKRHVAGGGLAIACIVGVFVWLLGPATATGQVKGKSAPRVTVITVTAGKPSELAFKLSKFSALPAGTITFKVTNKGLAFHSFKLCAKPVASSAANSCVGKVTPVLKPGESATLTLTLSKSGMYEYLCAVTGHAAAGMKGLVGIGVKVTPPATPVSTTTSATKTTTTTTAATTTAATTTTTPVGGGGGGNANAECPAGTTIAAAAAANGGDADLDDGGAPSDGDGCV